MNLNKYQDKAMQYALYEDEIYPVLGLAEECGEVSRLFAKVKRGDKKYVIHSMDGGISYSTEYFDEQLKKELGDVLWMISAIARDSGVSLDEIAKMNLEKLSGRDKDGTIQGDGDDR